MHLAFVVAAATAAIVAADASPLTDCQILSNAWATQFPDNPSDPYACLKQPGITSNDNKHIDAIEFNNKPELVGTLPDLSGLTMCTTLSLWTTGLTGPIPSLPPNLYGLTLVDAGFTGTIPLELPQTLVVLNLKQTQLSGPFPKLPNTVTTVYLNDNLLSGSIPATLPPNLATLNLMNNSFNGVLPDVVKNFNAANFDGNCFDNAIAFNVKNRADCSTPVSSTTAIPTTASTITTISQSPVSTNSPTTLTDCQILNKAWPSQFPNTDSYGCLKDPAITSRDNEHIYSIQFSNKPDLSLPDLSGLTKCASLSLWSTGLNGPIPNLPPNLYGLTIVDSGVTGTIPSNLPATLTVLNLNNNKISGPFPKLSNSMTGLSLANNQLSGSIPDSLPSNLYYFDVSNNTLTGRIPAVLAASNNNLKPQLSGNCFDNAASFGATNRDDCQPVQPVVSTATNTMAVSTRTTSDVISTTVSTRTTSDVISTTVTPVNLTDCQILSLAWPSQFPVNADPYACLTMPGIESRDNKYINTISFYQKDFTGPMPDLSGLTKCGSLYLTSTKVSGPLPNLPPNLYNLGLSDNNLTGPLPSVWPAHLSTLNLRNNQIAGPFPNLPNTLTGVFLSNNMLSGSIPDSIPPFLNAFDVSNNKLDGFIPSSLSPRLNFNPVLDGNCFVNAATFKATNRKDCPADTPIVSASESPKVSATVTNGPIASTVSSVAPTPSQSCDPRLPSDPITNPCPIKKPSAEIANLASGPIPSSGALSIYNNDSVQLIAKLNIQLPAALGKVNASKLASSLFSIAEPVTPGIPAKFAGAAIPSSNDTTPGLNAIVMLVTPSRYQAIKYENLQTYNEASSGTVSAEILPIGFSITYVFGNFIKSVWFTFDLHNDGTLIIAANTGNSVLASVQIDGNLFALRRDASATFALVLGVAPVDIPSSSVPTAVILPSSSLSTIQSAIAKYSAVTSASEFFTTTTIPVLPTGATMSLLTGTKAILTTAAATSSLIGTKETVTSAIYGTMLPSPSASASSSSSGSAEPKITKTRSIDIKVGSSRRNCYLGLTLALLFVMI